VSSLFPDIHLMVRDAAEATDTGLGGNADESGMAGGLACAGQI
jgi:hypothetical protein